MLLKPTTKCLKNYNRTVLKYMNMYKKKTIMLNCHSGSFKRLSMCTIIIAALHTTLEPEDHATLSEPEHFSFIFSNTIPPHYAFVNARLN